MAIAIQEQRCIKPGVRAEHDRIAAEVLMNNVGYTPLDSGNLPV